MSGKLVKHGKAIQHHCRPGCVLQSVIGTKLEHLGLDAMLIHDESMKYHDGDVWECDECHLRWTLHWPNNRQSKSGIVEQGSMRILPNSTDWVSETRRQFKRRIKSEVCLDY